MGRLRGVRPEIHRLSLSDGDYLDIKKELNAGEYRRVLSGMMKEQRFGEAALADPDKVGMTRVLAYLVGWSFCGLDGQPIPYALDLPAASRIATLEGLDTETWQEVLAAIDTHEAEQEKALAERKNGQRSEPGSPAISPSPSSTAGAITTSVN